MFIPYLRVHPQTFPHLQSEKKAILQSPADFSRPKLLQEYRTLKAHLGIKGQKEEF